MVCTFSSRLLQQHEGALERVCRLSVVKKSIPNKVPNGWLGLEFIWGGVKWIYDSNKTAVHTIFSLYFLGMIDTYISFMNATLMGNNESMSVDDCESFMVVGKSKLHLLHLHCSHFLKSPIGIIVDWLMLMHSTTIRDGESLSLATFWECKHHGFTAVIRKSALLCIQNGLGNEETEWGFDTRVFETVWVQC